MNENLQLHEEGRLEMENVGSIKLRKPQNVNISHHNYLLATNSGQMNGLTACTSGRHTYSMYCPVT